MRIEEKAPRPSERIQGYLRMDLPQMLGLDPSLVTHKLNIREGTRLIKQALRNFHLKLEV